MATAVEGVSIRVGVDIGEVKEQLTKLNKVIGDYQSALRKNFGDLGDLISTVTSKIGAAITTVVAHVSKWVAASAEQERADRRLLATAQLRGGMSRRELIELQRLNSERQRALGIGDEVQQNLQAQLLQYGVLPKYLSSATNATIGLATATGKTLNEAAVLTGKALTGHVEVLREVGIEVTTVAEASDELQARFSIAIAQSQTAETRYNALAASIGDLEEKLGDVVNRSPEVKRAIDETTDAVDQFSEVVQSPGFAKGLDRLLGFFRDFADKYTARGAAGPFAAAMAFVDAVATSPLDKSSRIRIPPVFIGPEAPNPPIEVPPVVINIPKQRRGDIPEGGFAPSINQNPDPDRLIAEMLIDAGLLPSDEEIQEINEKAKAAADRISKAVFEPYRKKLEEETNGLTEEQRFFGGLALTALEGISTGFTQMIVDISSGTTGVLDALRGFFGGIIVQLGTMLIQLGTAAVLASALSAIPIFAGLVGPPGVGAAVGLAAIAGGAAMVGLGTAIGGGGGGGGGGASASARPSRGRGDNPRGRNTLNGGGGVGVFGDLGFGGAIPAGFSSGGGGTIVNNYTIDMRGSTNVGEPTARVGRALQRFLDEATRLGGRRPT